MEPDPCGVLSRTMLASKGNGPGKPELGGWELHEWSPRFPVEVKHLQLHRFPSMPILIA